VIQKFGLEAWHQIKEEAGCNTKDHGFFKLETYSDRSTYKLVEAASTVLGITEEEVYYAFGVFFAQYIRGQGYETLLCCQGSTLKDWMTNINAIHHHIQTTFPKMIMPQFWCEDVDDHEDESLVLHYYSGRGSFLAPIAEGLITEVAAYQFEIELHMEKICTQGVDGAKYTR
jgi:guanylate cyclase soluble subunit beta